MKLVSQSTQVIGNQYFPYNSNNYFHNLLYDGTLSKLGPSNTNHLN